MAEIKVLILFVTICCREVTFPHPLSPWQRSCDVLPWSVPRIRISYLSAQDLESIALTPLYAHLKHAYLTTLALTLIIPVEQH